MPCKHAVAVINDMAGNTNDVGLPETWVHKCYWLTTWAKQYTHTINPCTGQLLWKKHPSPYTILPPKIKTQIGRPPKKRRKTADEISSQKMSANGRLSRVGKTVTCLKCHNTGHNKRTCKVHVTGVAGSQGSGVGGSQRSSVTGTQGSSVGGSQASARTKGKAKI